MTSLQEKRLERLAIAARNLKAGRAEDLDEVLRDAQRVHAEEVSREGLAPGDLDHLRALTDRIKGAVAYARRSDGNDQVAGEDIEHVVREIRDLLGVEQSKDAG